MSDAATALGAKARGYRAVADQIYDEIGVQFDVLREQTAVDRAADDAADELSGPLPVGVQLVAGLVGIGEPATDSLARRLADACHGDLDAAQYALEYLHWKMRLPIEELLGQVVLPLAGGAVEVLLRGLFHLSYLLDEMAPAELSRRVAEATRGGPKTWTKKLESLTAVDVAELLGDQWPVLREVVARRQVLLHAGGRTDGKYVDRSGGAPAAVPLNTVLRCDLAYVDEAFDMLYAQVDATSLAVAGHFASDTDALADFATPAIYRSLDRRQWQTSAHLAKFALAGQPGDHSHDHARINWWMARKESGEQITPGSALRDEVDSWTPALSEPRTALALAALRDDVAGAIDALEKIVGPGSTGAVREVASWPLVKVLCERSPGFEAVLRRGTAGMAPKGWGKGKSERRKRRR